MTHAVPERLIHLIIKKAGLNPKPVTELPATPVPV